MEKEKTVPSSCNVDEIISSITYNDVESVVNANAPLTEVPSQGDAKINDKDVLAEERQEHHSEIAPISLIVNNKEQECDPSLKKDSINVPGIKESTVIMESFTKDFPTCEVTSYNSNTSQESVMSNESENVKLMCGDKKENHFDDKLSISYQPNSVEENTIQSEHKNCKNQDNVSVADEIESDKLNSQSVGFTDKVEVSKNILNHEGEAPIRGEQNSSVASIKSSKPPNNLTSRPTLADDSRLVKISLPTNPMNIMQSNAQFLNKSRNFLNFITEKSTNIMERALLPQHLAVKYNSVLKSMDGTYSEKKDVDNPCIDMGPPLVDTISNSAYQSDLLAKEKSISNYAYDSVTIKNTKTDDQLECTEDRRNDTNSTVNLQKEEIYNQQTDGHTSTVNEITREIPTNKSNVNSDNRPSSTSKMDSLNCTAVIANETNGNAPFAEINGNTSEHNGCTVLSTEDNDCHLVPNTNLKTDGESIRTNSSLESPTSNLLQHPAYLTLLKDYADLKGKNLKLQERLEYLDERNRVLEAEKSGEIFAVQMQTLEKTVDRLTNELRTSLTTQETLKKEYNAANRERESMVMKYAVGEKQLIDTQRARDYAERKVKEMIKEQDLLQSKLRQAQGERTRICNILDGKCREVAELQKEIERLREDVKMRDVKLHWTQNKLKTEMDLQKETQQKLDKATTRINEMREECEQVRKDTQESMRKFQQSEENKAVTLDQQLKEQQARLILERHVTEDKEMLRLQLQKEVEVLKHRQQALIEENNNLSLKIQDSEKNRLNYESNFSNLKVIADQRQKEIVDLLSKVSELETLKLELQHKEQRLASLESEMEHLRSTNEELQSDMRACRQREADMLDFTQKLTDKNVRLQSEFTAIEAKAKQLEEEHGPLHERIRELTDKIKELEESLIREQKTRSEECEILAKHLAEQTQHAQNLAQKLEDSQGENAVLKRKQQLTTKEMTRELQQCRKRLEAFETASPCNSLDVTSRTGSNASLNTGDTLNGALSDNSANGEQTIQSLEPSRQALMDRIIKLQKINVRRAEKIDFLEEHNRTLMEELQKKNKIIQNYILHENFGAMGSNERDRHKHIKSRRNAAELARHGGIMASVYNQRVSDDNMTLELSLEINQKLQVVLEDALLKNITLKDNIDTLGEEIARLTMQNQQRQITN